MSSSKAIARKIGSCANLNMKTEVVGEGHKIVDESIEAR